MSAAFYSILQLTLSPLLLLISCPVSVSPRDPSDQGARCSSSGHAGQVAYLPKNHRSGQSGEKHEHRTSSKLTCKLYDSTTAGRRFVSTKHGFSWSKSVRTKELTAERFWSSLAESVLTSRFLQQMIVMDLHKKTICFPSTGCHAPYVPMYPRQSKGTLMYPGSPTATNPEKQHCDSVNSL